MMLFGFMLESCSFLKISDVLFGCLPDSLSMLLLVRSPMFMKSSKAKPDLLKYWSVLSRRF